MLNGRLTIRVSILKTFAGGVRPPKLSFEADTFFGRKNDVVMIVNSGHYCGYLAITLGFLYANNQDGSAPLTPHEWRRLYQPNSKFLESAMLELFHEKQIDITTPFDMSRAPEIQQKFSEHQFIVIQRPTSSKTLQHADKPLFKGEANKKKKIIIEHVADQNHYNMIKKMTGYHTVDHWCYQCWRSVHKSHICPGSCKCCLNNTQCLAGEPHVCPACNVKFESIECFSNHIENDICMKQMRCSDCEIVYDTSAIHECDTTTCPDCSETYSLPPHFCYLKPRSFSQLKQQDDDLKVIVAFDIEARLQEVEVGYFEHKANLLVSHTVCDQCYTSNSVKTTDCLICGQLEHIYFGDDCVSRFVSHVMNDLQKECVKKKVKRIFIVAHNFKGYDGRFILQELFERRYVRIDPIFTGTKILKLDVGLVRFIDSVSFLPLKLEQLPKSFPHPGLHLKKGTFPHLFNREENYNYNQKPWPALAYYAPEGLMVSARQALEDWHAAQQDKVFNFKEELISYCRTDVKILMHSIQTFRLLFKQITGLDVLTRTFTLASAALETFRTLHLKKQTIGITPIEGYTSKKHNGSIIAQAWLDYMEKLRNTKIFREKKIGNYFADGYDPTTTPPTVFEFLGCAWHGCLDCFRNREGASRVAGKTNNQLFEETVKKLNYYARRFNVIAVWEHEVRDNSADPYINNRYNQLRVVRDKTAVSIRDSLCGGRTENFKLMYVCFENERLCYYDFTSLYPFVLKNRKFPLGHPEVITEGLDIDSYLAKNYFGFVYAKILPPQDLDLPVLPYKCNNKLMFGLCRTCMTTRERTCEHSESQRALDFVYTTPQVEKAVAVGYKILELYVVLHYPQQCVGLFKDYIDMFLKIKQETSGLPPDVSTDDEITAYINEYEQKEGIRLDKASIVKNDGLRLISKLMLNSLWGKLAQRTNMEQTAIITDYQTLSELVGNENIEVLGASIFPNDNVIATYKFKSDLDAGPGNTSPATACFVTAWAQLELYNLMEQIENVRPGRVCYVDTDSVIFVEKDDDPPVPLGNFLGELTDEIPAGSRCQKIVCCGCKSYGLEIVDADGTLKHIVKVKGLSLTSEASSCLDFNRMEEMIRAFASNSQGPDTQTQMVPQTVFRPISRFNQSMTSRNYEKKFQITSIKRYHLGFETHPYGYKTTV